MGGFFREHYAGDRKGLQLDVDWLFKDLTIEEDDQWDVPAMPCRDQDKIHSQKKFVNNHNRCWPENGKVVHDPPDMAPSESNLRAAGSKQDSPAFIDPSDSLESDIPGVVLQSGGCSVTEIS